MRFYKLSRANMIQVKRGAFAKTYQTRIMSDGKQEATDTITIPEK